MHHDSGGQLRQSALSGSGYIFTTGLVARPGIYLYQINGRVVRELVLREVLQDEEYLESFLMKPLTVMHNQGPTGPHYTIDELGTGNVAGCTGASRWSEEDDAQELMLSVFTADGAKAVQNGAIYLSPAYPARLHFFNEPQQHPEFGFFDAIQVQRGEVNHTTLTDSPRGGERMKMTKADGNVAQFIKRADSNQTQNPFPSYPNGAQGYFQQQPQQPQQFFQPRADMGGDPQMMQMMQQMLTGQKELTGAVMQLVQKLTGEGQQAPAQGDIGGGSPNGEEEDDAKGDSYIKKRNEWEDALAFADALEVEVDRNWDNAKLKRAVVYAANQKLSDGVSNELINELFKSMQANGLPGQQSSGPSPSVLERHRTTGAGLTAAAKKRADSSQGGPRKLAMNDLKSATE